MHFSSHTYTPRRAPSAWALSTLISLLLAACGGGGGGPSVQAQVQSISFDAAPSMTLETRNGIATGSVTIQARASSGLPVSYSSVTAAVCSVDKQTGVVTVNGPITASTAQGCRIAVDQYGNADYAPVRQEQVIPILINPAQSILFAEAPPLGLFSTTTVLARSSSGLPVRYGSATAGVCTVDATTGLVTDLTAGDCVITAHQDGDQNFHAAADVTQALAVRVPEGVAVPGQPTQVSATLGNAANTVSVSIGATDSGGSAITAYVVTSTPPGLSATGTASPIVVACGGSCNGRAFTVVARNAVGDSAPSAPADVITAYTVVETFYEPATQPNDSIFTGSFRFNATTGTVTDLAGSLTQSMTGGGNSLIGGASSMGGHYGDVPMTLVPLTHQLSVRPVILGGAKGLLVTTFHLSVTDTFFQGGVGDVPLNDGWSPDAGVDVGGVYNGFPKATNPYDGGVGNAYAMIFVNTADPTAPPAQDHIDRLAYADCTAGGMMGAACMTGTAVAGYTGTGEGSVGSMGGYPKSLVILRKP